MANNESNISLARMVYAHLEKVKKIEINPKDVAKVPKDAKIAIRLNEAGHFILSKSIDGNASTRTEG